MESGPRPVPEGEQPGAQAPAPTQAAGPTVEEGVKLESPGVTVTEGVKLQP